MGRQYLNLLFTPTVALKGHTEGLCGVMDNDPSNDLKGPDGEQYIDPIQFADSCTFNVMEISIAIIIMKYFNIWHSLLDEIIISK